MSALKVFSLNNISIIFFFFDWKQKEMLQMGQVFQMKIHSD